MPPVMQRERTVVQGVPIAFEEGNFDALDSRVFPEAELAAIAERIKKTGSFGTVFRLIDGISLYGRAYDWNVGSILRHFDAALVIDSLQLIGDKRALYDSIGLAWALGEYHDRSRVIVDHLYAAVREARDSDAWWQAAFSLEKLGVDDAVNLLKRSLKPAGLKNLEYYLERLDDKRSLVGILLHANVADAATVLHSRIRKVFLEEKRREVMINCAWLIGRLQIADDACSTKLLTLSGVDDYELKYYAFFALQNNPTERLRPIFENALSAKDVLTRKLAARALRSISSERSLAVLEDTLFAEKETAVILELTKTISRLKNPSSRERQLIKMRSCTQENGVVSDADDEDRDPSLYNLFAEAQDPENMCSDLVLRKMRGKKIAHPIDLATGTGRTLLQILRKMDFTGTLCGVDVSNRMCEFAETVLARERTRGRHAKIVRSTIVEFAKDQRVKSDLIVSSFGFPSRRSDADGCLAELRAVHDMLSDDGEFYTIGWDETFNDELSALWFKYIPDNINAKDFDEWREHRLTATTSPRNCGLTWFKRGIAAPLQFGSLKEAASVMGYLFGRDAAQYVVRTGKIEWAMSLGITRDTKKDLARIIKAKEKLLGSRK